MKSSIERYLPYLDQHDWSREQKIEMIRTVWRVMEAEADKAFGLNPVQLPCGQIENIASHPCERAIDSRSQFIQISMRAANDDGVDAQEGEQDAA